MSGHKIAYVAGEYPLVSLTFIQREIAALRDLGLDVFSCAMRRTPTEQHPGPAEKDAAATTFYVLEALRRPSKALAAQSFLVTRTWRYLRALRLAWATRSPGLKAALYQLIYFLEATVLARHVEAQDATHMHNHFTTGSATVTMLASELTGIPYSFTLHGPADLLEPYRWRLDEKTARADFVITISHYARSQLMFFSDPAHWEKIQIVHCGVYPERFLGDPPTREDDRIRLLFVGRIAPVKGLRILIEAVKQLADEIPNLTLTLVGDGPDRRTIEAAAESLGDRIHFTGILSQNEVAKELKSADICVLPSFAEGVPVFLMEAFASCKPVIATQVAGVGELVDNAVNGLLIPPGDVDSLSEAIRTLAGDPEMCAAMGTAGQKRVEVEFNIRKEAKKLATLFMP